MFALLASDSSGDSRSMEIASIVLDAYLGWQRILRSEQQGEMSGAVEATQLIFTGVFDRFPLLQIFWAENNVGWIPYFYQQMDQTYKVNCHWAEKLLGLPKLTKLPSEYLREHAHWGVFDDPIGIQLRHMIGVDKIMWSTDFPHIVTRWPKSLELVEEQFAGVPEHEKRAMLARNAVKFFHLDAG